MTDHPFLIVKKITFEFSDLSLGENDMHEFQLSQILIFSRKEKCDNKFVKIMDVPIYKETISATKKKPKKTDFMCEMIEKILEK